MDLAKDSKLRIPSGLLTRYRPVRELGRGGMGVVFEVEDRDLGRHVALKISTHLGNQEAQARFLREAAVAARLRHPNVIEVFDSGIFEGVPYLVMELVDGAGLDDLPPPEDPEAVFRQVAAALEVVHAAGLVHRDVKPGNILCAGDRVLLTDFGLVHDPGQTALTRTGNIPGTVAYMAPEVLRGDPLTPAADWWSLGVSLFEVVERRMPYELHHVMSFAAGTIPPLPTFRKVPDDSRVARLARAWAAAEPADRPGSAAAIRRVLGDDAAVEPVPPPPEPPPRPPAPPPNRRPWLLGLAAGAILAGAAATRLRSAAPAQVPAPPQAAPAPARFPALEAALEVLGRPAFQDELLDFDPWRWGAALTQSPEILALLPLLQDPAARDPLAQVDARLRELDRPALLAPHLEHQPASQTLEVEDLAEDPPLSNMPRYWPVRPGPHLSRAGELAPPTLAAYRALVRDITQAERGEPTSETFPFPRFQSGVFTLNGWDLATGLLETRADLRQEAREWFRPTLEAYRALLAATGASLREEPSTRPAAMLLAAAVTSALSRAFYSELAVLEFRFLLGHEPRSPEGRALEAVVRMRQAWVVRRGQRENEPLVLATLAASRAALEAPPRDMLGAWVRARALEEITETARTGHRVPDLPKLVAVHLPAILHHAPVDVVAEAIQDQVAAARDQPELGNLPPALARLALDFLDRNPGAWRDVKPKRAAEDRARLAALAAGPEGG